MRRKSNYVMNRLDTPKKVTLPNPPGMQHRIDVSFRSHIGQAVEDHAGTSSRRRSWYVTETDQFEMSLQRLIGTYIQLTNFRRRKDVPVDIPIRD